MRKRAILLAVAAVFIIVDSEPVWSLPPGSTGFEITWYSDSSYTEAVGGRYMECEGVPENWGERTEYYQQVSWSCPPDEPQYSCTRGVCYKYYDVWGEHWDCWNIGGCS